MPNTCEAIVIHHEGAANGFKAVNEYHRRKWDFKSALGYYMGYGYYIDFDGVITQARADTEEQAHCLGGWNKKSIGICLMGHLGLQSPTNKQREALDGLLERLQERYSIPNDRVYAHRELWPTECCGNNLYAWLLDYRKHDLSYIAIQINRIGALIFELVKLWKGRKT